MNWGVTCPKCRSANILDLWDEVRWCKDCYSSFMMGDPRFVLVCSTDREKLVPAVKWTRPTLICPRCKKVHDLPPPIHEEVHEGEI